VLGPSWHRQPMRLVLQNGELKIALQFAHLHHRAARHFRRAAGLLHRLQRVGDEKRLAHDLAVVAESSGRRQRSEGSIVALNSDVRRCRSELLREPFVTRRGGLGLIEVRYRPGVLGEQVPNRVFEILTKAATGSDANRDGRTSEYGHLLATSKKSREASFDDVRFFVRRLRGFHCLAEIELLCRFFGHAFAGNAWSKHTVRRLRGLLAARRRFRLDLVVLRGFPKEPVGPRI
jgi:hypothetical protein